MTREEYDKIIPMIHSSDQESYRLGFDLLWSDDDFMDYVKRFNNVEVLASKYAVATKFFLEHKYPLYNDILKFYYPHIDNCDFHPPYVLLLHCFLNRYLMEKEVSNAFIRR